MTIRKGEPWGEEVPAAPADLRITYSDRAVSEGPLDRPVGLAGGDLARTLGGGAPGRLHTAHVRATVDLLHITTDAGSFDAVAHVVLRRSWWRGDVVLAMNAQFLGPYDVAPRSHPNDGRVDVLRVEPTTPFRARLQARRRARTGTHLPHPQLLFTSTSSWTASFVRPLHVYVDGQRVGRTASVAIHVRPDALIVHA